MFRFGGYGGDDDGPGIGLGQLFLLAMIMRQAEQEDDLGRGAEGDGDAAGPDAGFGHGFPFLLGPLAGGSLAPWQGLDGALQASFANQGHARDNTVKADALVRRVQPYLVTELEQDLGAFRGNLNEKSPQLQLEVIQYLVGKYGEATEFKRNGSLEGEIKAMDETGIFGPPRPLVEKLTDTSEIKLTEDQEKAIKKILLDSLLKVETVLILKVELRKWLANFWKQVKAEATGEKPTKISTYLLRKYSQEGFVPDPALDAKIRTMDERRVFESLRTVQEQLPAPLKARADVDLVKLALRELTGEMDAVLAKEAAAGKEVDKPGARPAEGASLMVEATPAFVVLPESKERRTQPLTEVPARGVVRPISTASSAASSSTSSVPPSRVAATSVPSTRLALPGSASPAAVAFASLPSDPDDSSSRSSIPVPPSRVAASSVSAPPAAVASAHPPADPIAELANTGYLELNKVSRKALFLTALEHQYLNRGDLRREDVLDLFARMRVRNGAFQFLHAQENPCWDRFRLFFKTNRNGPQDANFWHTAEYQKAVRLLKDKYLTLPALQTPRQLDENAFIDYVRGNGTFHSERTFTRTQFRL